MNVVEFPINAEALAWYRRQFELCPDRDVLRAVGLQLCEEFEPLVHFENPNQLFLFAEELVEDRAAV